MRIVPCGWGLAALAALPGSLWAQEIVPISTEIPECSVRLREAVALGAFDDPGTISFPAQITRLRTGEYALVSWLNGAEIMVFDSTGQYRRSLGRAGDGPGEFLDPGLGKLRAAPAGHLFVLDPGLRRITHLSTAGDALETVDLGSLLAFNFLPLSDAGPFAVGGWGDNHDATIQVVDTEGGTLADLSALAGERWMRQLFFFPWMSTRSVGCGGRIRRSTLSRRDSRETPQDGSGLRAALAGSCPVRPVRDSPSTTLTPRSLVRSASTMAWCGSEQWSQIPTGRSTGSHPCPNRWT
ncbi:hypothetical protein [Candidatus Palauibacter sp.]|uniref:hypothetical protein n=1 Tax=Candidatus Palauibacter sp. TaxID=3101350 RepID=UPI003B5B1091